jgi:23S rRNA (cytidine2498-2'-O)-methyltransferase
MSTKTSHIVLARPGFAELLREEFQARWQVDGTCLDRTTVAYPEKTKLPPFRNTVFARQVMPLSGHIDGTDLEAAATAIIKRLDVVSGRANRQTGRWTMHVFALDDDEAVQRSIKLEKLIVAKLKVSLARFFKRHVAADAMAESPAQPGDFVVQVYLPNPKDVWLSVANAADVSLHIGGNLRMRDRDGAPSRSARKLEEAFVELGRLPQEGDTAVDLGAAPGGWTFALARHGANVTAIDNAELDLPDSKPFQTRVTHLKENGLKYEPPVPVDWLVCDMVILPRETLKVLERWFERNLMQRFVVNLKLPDAHAWPDIAAALELINKQGWSVVRAKHLYHDRREITLMGEREPVAPCGQSVQ